VAGDEHAPTASERRQEIQVHRSGPGRYVLRVGDEVRACAERDLPEALRQSLGLGIEDALALAKTLRADARGR
jgi:predicted nucleic acid-binding protein